jgi:hypothetical protein
MDAGGGVDAFDVIDVPASVGVVGDVDDVGDGGSIDAFCKRCDDVSDDVNDDVKDDASDEFTFARCDRVNEFMDVFMCARCDCVKLLTRSSFAAARRSLYARGVGASNDASAT